MANRSKLAAAILVVFLPLPCAAQDDESDGVTSTILEKCIAYRAQQDPDKTRRRECIGRAAQDCMGQPGGDTTQGMADCARRELNWWDALLNSRYQLLKQAMPADQFKAFRKAQRAWIEFRDADCGFVADHQFAGGSIRVPSHAFCLMDATALRAIKLGQLLEHYQR